MTDERKSHTASARSVLGLNKAIIVEEEIEPVKIKVSPRITPVDFEINELDEYFSENKTMGFIAPPNIITNLIKLITLPRPPIDLKDLFEFDRTVLHFDGNRREIWWSNEASGGNSLVNFGHATYDYFEYCWGDGEVVIDDASELLDFLKESYFVEQVMLFAYPEDIKYHVIQLHLKRQMIHRFNIYHKPSEIITQKPRVDYERYQSDNPLKLDDNYIPIMLNKAPLKYGGNINASELKTIVEIGKKHGSKTYTYDYRLKPDLSISLKINEKLEALALALEGDVILRLSMDNLMNRKSQIYLLKVEENIENRDGLMCAGMLIEAKGDNPPFL